MTRADRLAAAALWLITFAVFAAGASRLGFYYDDAGAVATLPSTPLLQSMYDYIPGRNLKILWMFLTFKLTGHPATHLPVLHWIQSAMDGIVAVVFFLLLRRVSVPAAPAFLSAALFTLWPTHGETHFWLTALPQNTISTLFVLLFALTLAFEGCRAATVRERCLSFLLFLAALLTYEQVFFVLLGLAILRIRRPLALTPYLLASAAFVWIKLRIEPGQAPVLQSGTLHLVLGNIVATLSQNFGRLWIHHVFPLWQKATLSDWVLSFAAAAIICGITLRLLKDNSGPSPSPRLFAVAILFSIAAYAPAWMWHVFQRHHSLPSAGLFAAGAVCLAAVLRRWQSRPLQATVVFALSGFACLFAAAGRGESRYWEQSFTLKRQMFTELRPLLRDKQILALNGFPLYLGPAYFISPPDALHSARVLAGADASSLLDGDISAAPAPNGIFLRTLATFYPAESFEYFPTDRFLLVNFVALENDRLQYDVSPMRPPYQTVSISRSRAADSGPFAANSLSARSDGKDMLVGLRVQIPPLQGSHLAAVVRFANARIPYHPWSLLTPERLPSVLPVLLGPCEDCQLEQTLRLSSFPEATRLRLDFYRVGSHPPMLLGEAETAVAP